MNNLPFVLLDASQVRWIFSDLFRSLIWLGLFAAAFLAYYYYVHARNRERMAMIEKGSDLSQLYNKSPRRFYFPWFKLILTILGGGVGGLVFFIMTIADREYGAFRNIDAEVFVFVMILIFGAIGMLGGHFMDIRYNKKDTDD